MQGRLVNVKCISVTYFITIARGKERLSSELYAGSTGLGQVRAKNCLFYGDTPRLDTELPTVKGALVVGCQLF